MGSPRHESMPRESTDAIAAPAMIASFSAARSPGVYGRMDNSVHRSTGTDRFVHPTLRANLA